MRLQSFREVIRLCVRIHGVMKYMAIYRLLVCHHHSCVLPASMYGIISVACAVQYRQHNSYIKVRGWVQARVGTMAFIEGSYPSFTGVNKTGVLFQLQVCK